MEVSGRSVSPIDYPEDAMEQIAPLCPLMLHFSYTKPFSVCSLQYFFLSLHFKENVLYLIYVSDGTTSVRFEVDMVARQGKSMIILIDKLVPEVGDTAMGGWLIAVEVSRNDLGDTNFADALVSERFVFSESSAVYTYTDSTDYIKPNFALKDNSRFVFMYSPLSSYHAEGEFQLSDTRLIMKTDDGKNTYVFKVDGNKYIFDAASSSKMPDYNVTGTPVPDGAVFERS